MPKTQFQADELLSEGMLELIDHPPDCLTQIHRHHWGVSQHLYVGRDESLAIAQGKAGGASSLHTHQGKGNGFFVVQGIVEIWSQHGLRAQMEPKGGYWSPAGEIHRMVFITDALLYEFYRGHNGRPIDLEDIQRFDVGWRPGEREVKSRLRRASQRPQTSAGSCRDSASRSAP